MKRKYIYTDKRHSNRAVMSTILGILSNVSLAVVIYLSFQKSGEIPAGYGFTGLFAVIFSLIGLVLGVVTVKDKAYYRIFPCLGILLNLTALGVSALIVYVATYV
ncbi:MAG: DUF6142 family protein [Ruminococcus flavefaciens]|nr:DUF6142 family protein [Ruminococcus flavefaciens]